MSEKKDGIIDGSDWVKPAEAWANLGEVIRDLENAASRYELGRSTAWIQMFHDPRQQLWFTMIMQGWPGWLADWWSRHCPERWLSK